MQNRIDLSASTRSFPPLFSFYAFGTIVPILVETSNSKLLHHHMNLMGLTITICSSNIPHLHDLIKHGLIYISTDTALVLTFVIYYVNNYNPFLSDLAMHTC